MRGLLLLSLLLPFTVWSYSIVIATDEVPTTKALELKKMFETLYPFNQFKLGLQIVSIDSNTLGCKADPKIPRLITCNSYEVGKIKFQYSANQVFVISKIKEYGGSGGQFPVMTAASPVAMSLHELMHGYKFVDEYEYSAYEASVYCKDTISAPNAVAIDADEDTDSNDSALTLYRDSMPWGDLISATTLITHDSGKKIGTGTVSGCEKFNYSTTAQKISVGFYPSKSCKNASPAISVWLPSGKTTVMESLSCGLNGYYEQVISGILNKKRTKRIDTRI